VITRGNYWDDETLLLCGKVIEKEFLENLGNLVLKSFKKIDLGRDYSREVKTFDQEELFNIIFTRFYDILEEDFIKYEFNQDTVSELIWTLKSEDYDRILWTLFCSELRRELRNNDTIVPVKVLKNLRWVPRTLVRISQTYQPEDQLALMNPSTPHRLSAFIPNTPVASSKRSRELEYNIPYTPSKKRKYSE